MLQRLFQWMGRLLKGGKSAPRQHIAATGTEFSTLSNESLTAVLAYDENLLERSRTQWQFGDWTNLAALDRETLQHHPDRAKLAILAAAGHAQHGATETARQFVRLSQQWGCPTNIIAGVMVAGVYNHIGRASALAGDRPRSLRHFEAAVTLGSPHSDHRLLAQARINEQEAQLHTQLQIANSPLGEITKPAAAGDGSKRTSDGALSESENGTQSIDSIIEIALLRHPAEPALLVAHAEAAMGNGQYDEAIRRWQNMAAILGEGMLSPYYDRLHQAYQNVKSFPKGSPEEERTFGKGDKHELLDAIHRKINPSLYLEIGVQTGKSIQLALGQAIGVDPMPQVVQALGGNIKIIKATSDAFFAGMASNMLRQGIDMAFIDGMHLFEYVLRDFINVEKYSKPRTLVFIDDIFPGHEAQARRTRVTRAWTGDVWKILPTLQKYRSDLSIQIIDIYPTGLLAISGLNPASLVLSTNYQTIVDEYKGDIPVPTEIINRSDARSGDDPQLPADLYSMVIN